MSLRLLTPATGLAVSLDQFKEHGAIDGGAAADDLLTSYLFAAQNYCEKIRGESFLPTTYLLSVAFPEPFDPRLARIYNVADDITAWVKIPIGPVIEVVSIMYYPSEGGSLQTLPTDCYRVNVDEKYIAFDDFIPCLEKRENALQITFIAGYTNPGESESSIDEDANYVPEHLIQAIRLLAGEWFKYRENFVDGRIAPISVTVDRLLRL